MAALDGETDASSPPADVQVRPHERGAREPGGGVAGLGPLRAVEVVGTFPSGMPRGNPLDYENTLLNLVFEEGESAYVIRWNNGRIAMTEVPQFRYAAEARVQPDGEGGVVSWNIVFNRGVRLTPRTAGMGERALVVRGDGAEVVATRREGGQAGGPYAPNPRAH